MKFIRSSPGAGGQTTWVAIEVASQDAAALIRLFEEGHLHELGVRAVNFTKMATAEQYPGKWVEKANCQGQAHQSLERTPPSK